MLVVLPIEEKEADWLHKFIQLYLREKFNGRSPLNNEKQHIPSSLQRKNFGVFITLLKNGKIESCFGNPYLNHPTIQQIKDLVSHFPPISREELLQLHLEISTLTPPIPITPEKLQLGIHGVIIQEGDHKSLYLPQVAINNHWSKQTLLENLCTKAKLPKDTWKKPGLLFSFYTQVFHHPIDDTYLL